MRIQIRTFLHERVLPMSLNMGTAIHRQCGCQARELELFRVNALQLIADVKERMRHPVTPEASVVVAF